MARFRYKGRGQRGELVEGQVEAANAEAVATQLTGGGIVPVDIAEIAAQSELLAGLWKRYGSRRPELTDLILLTRQLYALMRAGVPINQAIGGLVRSTRNAMLAAALQDVQVQIESGRELSFGFTRHPKIFPTLLVAMIQVGENTGRLDEALLQISQYLEVEKETRARVKGALRYPVMVMVAMAIAIGIINVVVIPKFAQVFQRAHVELPLPTRVLIGTSRVFVEYWPMMIAALVVAIIGARMWVNTDAGRMMWDRWKLHLPLVGDILMRATLGRFARAFSMALSAGVPLVQTLTVISHAVDNVYVGAHIANMCNGIQRGETLTRTASATRMFTPLVLQMLSVGEESGSIDQLMVEVAGFYEREVDYDIKNLSQTIEPVMIMVLGFMVLVLALGVFLPMWDLAAVKLQH